jgi:glycosyltransferase involved in cell wall biosynthesis
MNTKSKKIIYVYNSASYLYNFRLGLLKAMRERGWEVTAAAPFDGAAKKIEAQGIRFLDIPLSRKGKNPLVDLWTFFSLLTLYFREKPDAVHHFTIKPVLYGTAAARLARIPGIVNTIPGLGYVHLKGGLIQSLVETMYRLVLSPSVKVIFQNKDDLSFFVKKRLVDRGQSCVISGSGVNTEFFSAEKFPDKPLSSQITFLLVARMLWDKGISEYTDAATLVREKIATACFFLLGSPDKGNPSSVPSSWLEKKHKCCGIKWIKHVEDVRPFLAGADVVVLPSYREGSPRVLMEAAAMAKPIIATDVPGCRDVVEEETNGLLVPPRDTEALARAMIKMAWDPTRRREMGLAGRERALKDFDERIIIRQTIEFYDRFEGFGMCC